MCIYAQKHSRRISTQNVEWLYLGGGENMGGSVLLYYYLYFLLFLLRIIVLYNKNKSGFKEIKNITHPVFFFVSNCQNTF